MRFEWDAEKNRINQQKHGGLDFETAARVFDDPDLILRRERAVESEERSLAIGSFESHGPEPDLAVQRRPGGPPHQALLVVHVWREDNENGEEIIRIISARAASQRERRVYLLQAAG